MWWPTARNTLYLLCAEMVHLRHPKTTTNQLLTPPARVAHGGLLQRRYHQPPSFEPSKT
jgi:hypothetical protein